MNEYNIEITGLSENKEYFFDFKVDDGFFANRNNPQLTGGSIDVEVTLLKKSDGLFLDIEVSGTLDVICNRCLDCYPQHISFRDNIVVNFDNETNFDTTESYVILDKKANEINISRFIYEFCEFALPISCVHSTTNGETNCNKKMLEILNKYNKEEPKVDPRWEKLKQFIN